MTSKRDSYAEFLNTLNRERTELTEAMQKGIAFEDLVTEIVNGHGDRKNHWYEAASRIADIVRGGPLQYKALKEITVNGIVLALYGRLDALKAGVVYDIKFSSSYEIGRYIDSTQHPTYLELVPEAKKFTYLVSNGSWVWPETYTREETPSIIPTISDFLNWLESRGLMEIYQKKWLAK